ncbi:MAG: chorismate synthase [Deltaproteobacteria bacterium]|jgi:chorismate synthase|nr:chorismate synthase [Deltaproteobacteria bacterium]
MASNSFGLFFRYSTWGESHGPGIGVLVDGCPPGLPLHEDLLNAALARRAPGQNPFTSPRAEKDEARILSGVFEGKSSGAPISILIENRDAASSSYAPLADLLRPGHANFTYLAKYGCFDYCGGGRASARETAARVAAGVVARQLVASLCGAVVAAWLEAVGTARAALQADAGRAAAFAGQSPLFAPDAEAERLFQQELTQAVQEGDSVGGVARFNISGAPVGLGDPVYEKLSARLGYAMLSIPGCKGFELGEGFAAAAGRGSNLNDPFILRDGRPACSSNHAGGTLGGISNGEPIYGRAAFKPTSSIGLEQSTLDLRGQEAVLRLPPGSRHDPCTAVRAVPVVEAMCWLVLADALLMRRALGEAPCS